MPSNFPFVYFVIWTSAVICLNSGAPVKVKNGNVLDKFSTYFVAHKCRVLDSIVERPAGMDDPENFNISVPLEACSITELDDPVMPMCNEAFELITNLSTCRSDFETLNKALPLNEPINIAVQTDHVCEGLLANQSLFLRDPEFIAFKLGDKMLCSLVCSSKTLKACSFLLWGYRVQASLYGKTLPESGISKSAVAEEDAKNETQENANDINSSLKGHIQEEQSQDNSLANNVLPNDEDQQKSKNLADQLKPPDSESAKDKSSPGEGQNDIDDKKKSVLKVKSMNPKSTIVTSSSITRVAEKSTIRGNLSVSSDSSSNALPMQSSQNVTDVKAKSGATVDDGPRSGAATTLVHTKPHADKTSKGSVSTVPSSISNTVKKEKGKVSEASSPSFDAFSVGGSADALLTGKDVNPAAGNEEGTPEMKDPGDKNVIAKENEIPDDDDDDDDESPISENNVQTADNNPSEILHAGKITKETLSETPSSVAVIDMDDPKGDKSLQMDGNDGGGNIDNGGFDENGDPNTDFDDNSQLSQPEADDMENDAQGSASLVNSATADRASKDIVPAAFPEQEDTHFFFYFISIVIFAIGGYVLFHNKQKIFALIIEGRHERRRRSGASYRKLETK